MKIGKGQAIIALIVTAGIAAAEVSMSGETDGGLQHITVYQPDYHAALNNLVVPSKV